MCILNYFIQLIIVDRITCIDSGDSYPHDLIANGLTKNLLNSAE